MGHVERRRVRVEAVAMADWYHDIPKWVFAPIVVPLVISNTILPPYNDIDHKSNWPSPNVHVDKKFESRREYAARVGVNHIAAFKMQLSEKCGKRMICTHCKLWCSGSPYELLTDFQGRRVFFSSWKVWDSRAPGQSLVRFRVMLWWLGVLGCICMMLEPNNLLSNLKAHYTKRDQSIMENNAYHVARFAGK